MAYHSSNDRPEGFRATAGAGRGIGVIAFRCTNSAGGSRGYPDRRRPRRRVVAGESDGWPGLPGPLAAAAVGLASRFISRPKGLLRISYAASRSVPGPWTPDREVHY